MGFEEYLGDEEIARVRDDLFQGRRVAAL